MARKYKVIDLFSGAGGFALGFQEAGFLPVLAVEKEPDFARTYAANFGDHVLVGDISQMADRGLLDVKADVVVGGPPCQGFSNLTGNRADDPRRALWRYYVDVLRTSECKVFVVENVPNFLSSDEGEGIIREARKLGFHITDDSYGILKASDFGVPQNRRRAIIIGSKLGPVALPKPNGEQTSVREALKGVPLKPSHKDLNVQPAFGPDLHHCKKPN